MTVLTTIAEIEKSDAGTARMLLELALYEALCDEADRVGPQLEAEARRALVEKAQQGLVHLARQPVSRATIEMADQLVDLVEFGKATPDNPSTDYWDARGDDGRFISSGTLRSKIFNVLGFATRREPDDAAARGVAQAWAGPNADKYSRLRSLGDGLVSTQDPHARSVGTVARLIGDIGPEAQKALEPGIRRTAYRYRGTERRPDEMAQRRAAALAAGLQGPGDDKARLEVLSDLGVSMLFRQVPDKDTAAISLAAGKMPPSVGVMFDQQGRLVSEAQGFNGDHYLPFDLKNLKRLHGGSYVRTRTTGGLTDEDIYTGLMTGARKMTVVSNSGVFSIEFDPSVRGGRRYSDKARQMVDRYGRLVGAIGSGELAQRPLPREQVQQLRQEALKAAGGNAETARTIFQRREKEALAAQAFLASDEDELQAQAEDKVKADPKKPQGAAYLRAVKEEFNSLRAAEAQQTARLYRLDGQGYAAAMRALKTEFPYFIRAATFTPLQQHLDSRGIKLGPDEPRRGGGGSDLGYTKPGRLDPSKSGVPDAQGFKGRRVLGGADPRLGAPRDGKAVQGGAQGASVPAQGGAQGLPAATGKRTVQEVSNFLLEEKSRELASVLQTSLRARTVGAGAGEASLWNDPYRHVDGPEKGKLQDNDVSALQEPNPDAYAQWLIESKGGTEHSWEKVAAFLTDPKTDVEHVNKTIEALEVIKTKTGEGHAAFTPEGFDKAKKALEQVRMLKQPFREQKSPVEGPPQGNDIPPGLPEITSLPLDAQKITAAIASDPTLDGAMKKATGFASKSNEQIAKEIRFHADTYRRLSEAVARGWPGNEDAQAPAMTLTEGHLQDAKEIADDPQNNRLSRDLADMNRGWALKRMGELLQLSSPGAADPFAPVAKSHSSASSSRVHLADPSSPLARAVVAKLSRPSLRPVRMPVSR